MKVELKKPAMETMNDNWLDLYDDNVGVCGGHCNGVCGLDW